MGCLFPWEKWGALKTYLNDSEKWDEHRFSPVLKKDFTI
jgi:hypothetical protein